MLVSDYFSHLEELFFSFNHLLKGFFWVFFVTPNSGFQFLHTSFLLFSIILQPFPSSSYVNIADFISKFKLIFLISLSSTLLNSFHIDIGPRRVDRFEDLVPRVLILEHSRIVLQVWKRHSIIRGFGVLGFWGFGVLGFWVYKCFLRKN